MYCESGAKPNNMNTDVNTRDYSVGLFQINLYGNLKHSRPSEEWLKDAFNNITYAKQMYDKQGWQPWSCARKLGYVK